MRLGSELTIGRALIPLALLASIAAVVLIGGPAGAAPRQSATQPNILMIMTDDQTTGMLSKETMPKTIKQIYKNGTDFSQTIITTPTCCPSRASFMTGQFAHNHGVLENDYGLLRDDTTTLPTWLQAAGYETIHVGKYLNRYKKTQGATTIAPGWDEFDAAMERYAYYDYALRLNGKTKRYGDDDEDYLTTVLNGLVIDEIEDAAPSKKPFYLQYTPYAPHIAPGDDKRCDGAAVPAPEDYESGLFKDERLPRPESFNEGDVSDKPSFIQGLKELSQKKIDDLERRYGCALASLKEVDRGVGEIMDTLEETGELDNTIVIFVSDNGFFYGEHRIPDAKQNPYEEALRVPMAMRVPSKYLGGTQQPKRVSQLVANIDVPATILQFAGGAAPCNVAGNCRTLDGRSLVPLLQGQTSAYPSDRGFAIELKRIAQNAPVLGGRSCTYTGIRTPNYSYAHHTEALNPATRACEPVEDVEWYDLRDDPQQLSSLDGAAPGMPQAATESALAARSATLADCAGIQGRDPLPPSGHWCE
ncbi:MAG: sulfatase family protein [Solirubrobacterales bacterium]